MVRLAVRRRCSKRCATTRRQCLAIITTGRNEEGRGGREREIITFMEWPSESTSFVGECSIQYNTSPLHLTTSPSLPPAFCIPFPYSANRNFNHHCIPAAFWARNCLRFTKPRARAWRKTAMLCLRAWNLASMAKRIFGERMKIFDFPILHEIRGHGKGGKQCARRGEEWKRVGGRRWWVGMSYP